MACLLMPARSASAGRANPVRPGKLQHRHVRKAQFREARRVELADDTTMDRLRGTRSSAPMSMSFGLTDAAVCDDRIDI